ncbi:MAG: hypothetical protein ABSB37_09915 [Xanthobacteraceae bacterium]|jgi:hypothetical protein
MPPRKGDSLVRIGATLAVALLLADCTPGGQFDPTELLSSDMFGTKKKIQGDRQPLFPNGVPGAETGVPPDLVKGYQPPPEQSAENSDAAAKVAEAAAKPKPKPKPKPKVARAPATHDVVFDQKPSSAAPKSAQPAQSAWPAPPSSNTAQSGQSAWPAPPPSNAAQSGQSVWPAPPPSNSAQSGQSVWPAPPAPGTFSH